MSPRSLLSAVVVASLVAVLPAGHSEPAAPAAEDLGKDCAPPCGYIYPTIRLDVDLPSPYPASKLAELPETVNVEVDYYWDMEQDGTGIPGDTEEMLITIIISREPDWLDASLSQATCSFRLVPAVNEYEVCTITLSLEVVEYPTSEQYIEDFGKRLMLFATSSESGTFKKSYGVEDMRFQFDALPPGVEAPETASTGDGRAVPGPQLVAVLGVAALVAAVLRRRH